MFRGRGRGRRECPQQLGVATEDFRIRIDAIISDFMMDHSCEQYPFPVGMNNVMRRYVHERCVRLGLKSKSYGKEPNRMLVIFKKNKSASVETFDVGLSNKALDMLSRVNFNELPEQNRCDEGNEQGVNLESLGMLFMWPMADIKPPVPNPLLEFRKTLPVFEKKEAIMKAIKENNVVIISAETGSGKTTQIPQYILEEACANNQRARVMCTQPRRLSTISVADRVATERGERLGQTVGYQIKLEANVGMNTSLIYCTNGILLRSFMSGQNCFKHISHIIVDEIHERDKFTDFLLICLRETIKKFTHLRIILMSATMDMDTFSKYFGNPTVVKVQGRCFETKSMFLEEVLLHTNYENPMMNQLRMLRQRNGAIVRRDAMIATAQGQQLTVADSEVAEEMDVLLMDCLNIGDEDHFVHLLQLILNENVSPNYQGQTHQLTPLMVAAARGNVQVLERLLNLGADPFMSSREGITASGWAQRSNHADVVRILSMYQHTPEPADQPPNSNQQVLQILADYDRTVNEEFIDFDLIVAVIKYIHQEFERSGAILVFLPGYEDIMNCNDRIKTSSMDPSKYKVFMLHGSMQTANQTQVFARMPEGKQKIILSTNISETSITIDDVRYVVDSGKVKMKCYDTFSGVSSLRSQWISMASAMQRAGRAGRTQPGYCFHLYSLGRYNSFSVNTTPEILRVPLHELCLHAKSLASSDTSIQEFLNLAIEPPSTNAVKSSIDVLKKLGAIDADENLTQLGNHLLHLSIEPHLGKMLIYSVIFKCLDPVLTIVSCLAHKDPFVLPVNSEARNKALEKRMQLSDDILSDHCTMLRAFQLWEENKVHNQMHTFCDENFVSAATMELVVMTRTQLITQLRTKGFISMTPRELMNTLNTHSSNWAMVKACLSAGLYPNAAYYNDGKLHTRTEKLVVVNNTSALKQCDYLLNSSHTKRVWFMYEELAKMHGKSSIKCATAVTPLTIGLVCGLNAEAQDGSIVLDDWYELMFHNDMVPKFRALIDHVVQKKIEKPRFRFDRVDLNVINTLALVLLEEDIAYEMKQPVGIGNKPKILCNRFYPYDRRQETAMASSSHSRMEMRPSSYPQQQSWWGIDDPTAGILSQYNYYPSRFPPNALYFFLKTHDARMRPRNCRYSIAVQNKLHRIPLGKNCVILIHARQNEQIFCGVSRFYGGHHLQHGEREFQLDWITQNELPFNFVKHFLHPKPQIMQDGFQLQSEMGQRLCTAIYDSRRGSLSQPLYKRNGGGSRQMRPILGKEYKP